MDTVAWLAARAAIQDCILRYARGVDRRDWEAVRATYHPDAEDEHGEYRGTVDGFIDWVSKRHAPIPFSAHIIHNCLIEFVSDDTAIVETYFVATKRSPAPDSMRAEMGAEIDSEVIGRYVDRFERRDGGKWLVAARRVVYDSTRRRPGTFEKPAVGTMGRRDAQDPIFVALRQAR